MKIVILAAGIGSRLGKPHPKPLTMLNNGRSILQHQVKNLQRYVDIDDIFVVVGYKKELIMEAFPELTYIYNDYYDTTNTSKSLLRGLKKLKHDDVLWLNGDVVFDYRVIDRMISQNSSCMAVNNDSVAEEEVKYRTNRDGLICEVSKSVVNAQGEAVGVNKVIKQDISRLLDKLEQCQDHDYFERGIELAINEGMNFSPVNISDLMCTEIDFEEDLQRVNYQLANKK